MYEHKSRPLISRGRFFRRLAASVTFGLGVITVSLAAGMLGYRHFEHMSWVDAFANSAMILSGMGPLSPLTSDGSKIFAGCYALYSGFALISTIGLIFVPVLHRFLHRFHLEEAGQ